MQLVDHLAMCYYLSKFGLPRVIQIILDQRELDLKISKLLWYVVIILFFFFQIYSILTLRFFEMNIIEIINLHSVHLTDCQSIVH